MKEPFITPILPNMIPMRDINILEDGDRLFYELGVKRNIHLGYGMNWIHLGKFKEMYNTKEEILKWDKHILEKEYLEHHNFMIIKKNNNNPH